MSKVKLGIRVRPFTERELRSEKERTSVVNIVDDNTVTITNVKVSVSGAGDSRPRVRRYSADYAFDSACSPAHPVYATQEKIFDTIGREVVERVLQGCSACVLAYGQSATGKTYTMMGTEAEPGLVPRICRALAVEQPFEITVSYLEIYNERVHDLLAGESAPPTCHSLPRRRGNARKDLRVREHPDKGPYVQNLRRVAIHSVEALLALVNEGTKRRCTAATRRNSTSSRSHALLELATAHATLHLADLAGSEKAGWEGCGGRQKEGANINKSLVALSNVISALVSGGCRGRFVPYRDSALTWLLKDCFTGGASTFIIATVSPSVACYGESASTLRWSERARQLPNSRATATAPPATRSVLQAQYTELLAELARHYIRYIPETGKISYDDNHWNLNEKNVTCPLTEDKTTKIGGIMNLMHPKTDAQSESTASSVASGSSDVINTLDKHANIDIADEIKKEVDKLFVPTLERTQSNNDLKVIAPLRHKRRQYKSQEVLPIDEKLHMNPSIVPTQYNVLPKHSETEINDIKNNTDKSKNSHTPVLYDNQRAEIVASVTERLYNKIKKKEEAAASKMESVIDKKIMEPLNELRICTNARQRLVELSQKALRNKRRIGIPAHTQTRKLVTRVRDQGIDTQTDLEAYFYKNTHTYTLRRDVATETTPMTPRCKDKAVGSKYGILDSHDRSTITEEKRINHKNSIVMTDVVRKCDNFTQTQIVPPPRRKKSTCCCKCRARTDRALVVDDKKSSIISINIAQSYTVDSETQSSDDNSESLTENCDKISSVDMTPDLLTNHNTTDTKSNVSENIEEEQNIITDLIDNNNFKVVETLEGKDHTLLNSQQKSNDDFSDSDDCPLPRVTVDGKRKVECGTMKDIILGRHDSIYPYNIILSPPRDRDQSKILVKFHEEDIPIKSVASSAQVKGSTSSQSNVNNQLINDDKKSCKNSYIVHTCTSSDSAGSSKDSAGSSKADAESFIWRKDLPKDSFNTTSVNSLGRSYTPVYKSRGAKYAKAKAKLYREFLGLDKEGANSNLSAVNINSEDITSSDSTDSRDMFRQRRNYLESMLTLKPNQGYRSIEQELLNSCNSLEFSVNKYENYVANYQNVTKRPRRDRIVRTPTEYLQHLVQLRREVVRGDYDTGSSIENLP